MTNLTQEIATSAATVLSSRTNVEKSTNSPFVLDDKKNILPSRSMNKSLIRISYQCNINVLLSIISVPPCQTVLCQIIYTPPFCHQGQKGMKLGAKKTAPPISGLFMQAEMIERKLPIDHVTIQIALWEELW